MPQNVSESVRRRNPHLYAKNHAAPKRLCADEPECDQGNALGGPAPGETAGIFGPAPRIAIRFVVRSRRPADWDNLATGLKPIQDLLVKGLGILPDDRWDILQGSVVSEKADSAEEEGVTVTIATIPDSWDQSRIYATES